MLTHWWMELEERVKFTYLPLGLAIEIQITRQEMHIGAEWSLRIIHHDRGLIAEIPHDQSTFSDPYLSGWNTLLVGNGPLCRFRLGYKIGKNPSRALGIEIQAPKQWAISWATHLKATQEKLDEILERTGD